MNASAIKVLVIDDEPPIRKLLRMGLSTQGYDIIEASNGKLALEKLAEEQGRRGRQGAGPRSRC
jgi:two-component system, OmpR family, KDP operon response regulator KdpE